MTTGNDPVYGHEWRDLVGQPGPYSGGASPMSDEERRLMRALAKCWAERDAAYANLREVQVRCTEQREENRDLRAKLKASHDKTTALKSMVAADGNVARNARAFARLAGQPIPTHPVVPDEARVRLRLRLMDETLEVLEACLDDTGMSQSLADLRERFYHLVDHARVHVDLVALADGLADTVMVCEGFFAECGIDSAPVHAEVFRSNQTKDFSGTARGQKVNKGNAYEPPNLALVLAEQGWVGG